MCIDPKMFIVSESDKNPFSSFEMISMYKKEKKRNSVQAPKQEKVNINFEKGFFNIVNTPLEEPHKNKDSVNKYYLSDSSNDDSYELQFEEVNNSSL